MEDKKEGLPAFTAQEVSVNDGRSGVFWMIIHGFVLDVSEYRFVHPGKDQVLMKFAGKDATEPFEALYHSSRARDKLADLVIGFVEQGASRDI